MKNKQKEDSLQKTKLNYTDIIWDFDGTIVDTYPCVLKSINDYLAYFGIYEDDENTLKILKQSSSSTLVNYFIEKYNKFTVPEFFEKYDEIDCSLKNYDTMQLPCGIIDLLKRIVELGGRNFLVTNRIETVLPLIKMLNVEQYFTDVEYVGKNGLRAWKPAPTMFENCIKKYNLQKQNILSVGDRPLDAIASHNAGVAVCLINADLSTAEVKPEFQASNIAEIRKIIINE